LKCHGGNRIPHGTNPQKSDGGVRMTATLRTNSKEEATTVRASMSGTTEKLVFGGGTVLGIIVVWEILSRLGILPSASFPPASETLLRLLELVFSVPFWAA